MDRGRRLQDLLIVLFEDSYDLQRFLTLLDLPLSIAGRRTLSAYAGKVATELVNDQRLDDHFFDALEMQAPDRRRDIIAVKEFYRVPHARTEETPQGPPAAEEDDFTASLRAALEAIDPPDDDSRATDEQHFPWTAAAAVLGRFWPTRLRPVPGLPTRNTVRAALANLVHVDFTGHWTLRDDVRSECLRLLDERQLIREALRANIDLEDSKRDKLDELLKHGRPRHLADLRTNDLDDYSTVMKWLLPLGLVSDSARNAVQAALERRLVLDPLRTLVGAHFSGRGDELDLLKRHVHGRTETPLLVVQGAGGAGKSSLLGKVLLELERQAERAPISFAYIDFDRTVNDPRHPAGLLARITGQLRLLYAADREAHDLAVHETAYRIADRQLRFSDRSVVSTMIEELARELTRIRFTHGLPTAPPLVLVLDTFEEVQVKGPGAINDVLGLLRDLHREMPGMKVIVSGRGAASAFEDLDPASVIDVRDLDDEIAHAVLAQLGVDDPAFRRAIVRKFGGNPLTLRLAADVIKHSDFDDADLTSQAGVLAEVAAEMVQGMLYGRILSHIADPEVVRVAHPGLTVRRITPGVLRHVLAGPCGLDPERAEAIFDKLRLEVSMFEREDPETLWHRQDVRRLMLKTMLDEPQRAATVAEIHRRAITYYRSQAGLAARGEELYHRLMNGEDPRRFGKLWTPELRPSLEPALSEPLPDSARRWLERRLGRARPEDSAYWSQQDWEAEAADRALSWLASRRPREALMTLAERTERLPGSRLYPIQIDACLALEDVTAAARVLERGIQSAIADDDRRTEEQLAERAVLVYAALRNRAGVVNAARWAVRSCDFLGQPDRGVEVLAFAVQVLLRRDHQDGAEALGAELATRFTRLPRSVLRRQPDLVCRVLHAAGELEPALLHRAAAEVGEPEHKVFKPDAFVLERLMMLLPHGSLDELAAGMGVRSRYAEELASQAVRIGRTGQVVVFALDHAFEQSQVRRLVVEGLVRPVESLFPWSTP